MKVSGGNSIGNTIVFLTNQTEDVVTVNIDYGTWLDSDYASVMDMLVTE